MKNKGTNREGFTLMIVLIGLALISILGVTIVGITTSTFKMTKVDSRSQSAYYIAEAGVNYMINEINNEIENLNKEFNTSEEFFKHIEDEFTKEKYNLDSFNMNNGEKPKAIIDVSLTGENLGTKIYKIKSEGKIGNSNKTVSSIISIDWNKEDNYLSDILLSTNKFEFNGKEFNAPGKTIVISGQNKNSLNGGSSLNVKNIYFKDLKNGIISGRTFGDKNDPGEIYMDGNSKILSSGRIMYGNVHTNGDFIVTGGVDIYGDLYVGGKFEVTGGSNIYGDVYVKDFFQIKGGVTIHGNVYTFKDLDANGGATIKGNLNVLGDSKLVNIRVEGVSNINGNLELGWTPTFNKNVYYTGELTTPNSFKKEILDRCQKVNNVPLLNHHDYNFPIPDCTASLKPDSWFSDNGYTIMGIENGIIPPDGKIFVNNYDNDKWQKIEGNIIIVSKDNIILRGDKNFTGALIAPNGKVEYSGGGTFDGIVISNNEINLSGGGTTFNLKSIEELFENKVPITMRCSENDMNNEDNSSKIKIKLTIKSGIKEKQ